MLSRPAAALKGFSDGRVLACGNAISISRCNYQDKTFSFSDEGQSFLPWLWGDLIRLKSLCLHGMSWRTGASAAHALSRRVPVQYLLNTIPFPLSLNYSSAKSWVELKRDFHTVSEKKILWEIHPCIFYTCYMVTLEDPELIPAPVTFWMGLQSITGLDQRDLIVSAWGVLSHHHFETSEVSSGKFVAAKSHRSMTSEDLTLHHLTSP